MLSSSDWHPFTTISYSTTISSSVYQYNDILPRLSSSEWHPFTISSAPEVREHFTLHIRGVGHWTNSLHTLFQEEFRCQELGGVRSNQAGTWQAAAGTNTSLQIKYFMSLSPALTNH